MIKVDQLSAQQKQAKARRFFLLAPTVLRRQTEVQALRRGHWAGTNPPRELLLPQQKLSAPSAPCLLQSPTLSFPSIAKCQTLKKIFDNANVFSNDEQF